MVSERTSYGSLITSVDSWKNTNDFVHGVWKAYSAFQEYMPQQDPWRVAKGNNFELNRLQQKCSNFAVILRASAPETIDLDQRLSDGEYGYTVLKLHEAAYATLITSLSTATGQLPIGYAELRGYMREFANAMERIREFNDDGFTNTIRLLRILDANLSRSKELRDFQGSYRFSKSGLQTIGHNKHIS